MYICEVSPVSDDLGRHVDFGLDKTQWTNTRRSKSTNTWFNDHRITVRDVPAISPDHMTQQCRRAEGVHRRNLHFPNTSAGSNPYKRFPNQVHSVNTRYVSHNHQDLYK